MTDVLHSCQKVLKYKSQVALADRNSNAAKDNQEKLEKFVMSIK